jgi:hypothetical protein
MTLTLKPDRPQARGKATNPNVLNDMESLSGGAAPDPEIACGKAKAPAQTRESAWRPAQVETRVGFLVSARRVDARAGAREYPPD